MQQRPEQRAIDLMQKQRTQPALPGITQPTAPVVTPRQGPPPVRKTRVGWRTVFQLLGLGLLLEVLYLALYPLLASTGRSDILAQQVQQALPGLFPWLPSLYWTNAFPALAQTLSNISWLNTTNNSARVLLSTALLLLAGIVVLIAARIGGRAIPERLSRIDGGLFFWTMLLFAGLFGVTMLFAPVGLSPFSQDMLSYGLYGRMAVVHQVNPYGVVPTAFPQDMLQVLLGLKSITPYGPVWTDVSIIVALFAHDSIANILLGFRLVGLTAHVANAALLWFILARLKPMARLSATLLYAWNPLILLFGVAEMHQEIVLLFIVLLAVLFFQRNSPTMGWVLMLLTVLINLLWLPLLPLFFRLMVRQSRILRIGHRTLWWMGMVAISLIVVILAYVPYWHSLGLPGIITQLRQTFVPDNSANSLDSALHDLPVGATWLTTAHHWAYFALVVAGLALLLGLWLADTLELVLLFSSWVLLILAVLLPVYWPWYLIAPLTLALCSSNQRTILLSVLLAIGGLVSYYWLLTTRWNGQPFVTIGFPLLLWGWTLFFSSTWQMTRANVEKKQEKSRPGRASFSRPPWLSRPSRPGSR